MSVNYEDTVYAGSANAFKNLKPATTSITMSGGVGAGATSTFTATVTLEEDQDFAYAIARYSEFAKGGAASYQLIPTFDAYIASTPTGFLNTAIYFTVNGRTVTFTAKIFNPYAGTETLTTTTIPIIYVSYTLAQ